MSRTPHPHPLLVLVVLAAAGLACSLTTPPAPAHLVQAANPTRTPSPTSEPTPTQAASPTQADQGGPVCVVTAYALNVRDCPGVDCAAIDGLTNGQAVTAAPAADGWLVLTLADGRAGYIAARYCDFGE